MPFLSQLLDHAALHFRADLSTPGLTRSQAFLGDGGHLLQKFLTQRGPIERHHPAHLFGCEVPRIDQPINSTSSVVRAFMLSRRAGTNASKSFSTSGRS